MLIDTQYKNKKLIASYIDDSGDLKLKYINWENPYNWVECSEHDTNKHSIYRTWDGNPVKKEFVDRPNKYSIGYFLQGLPESEKSDIFGFKTPKVFFIDIETEIIDEFPDAENALTQVLTISIVWDTKVHILSTKQLTISDHKWVSDSTNEYFKKFGITFDVKFKFYDTEHKMLHDFVNNYVPKMPVITGWNFVDYDWQFLMNRCTRLNIDIKPTSPTRRMNLYDANKEVDKFGNKIDTPDLWIMPAHRVIIDYLDLYVKWDTKVKVKESSKLDFVADKLLGLKKIHYEGGLMDLYHNDYRTFVYYNVVDTILVYYLDKVCKFIDIMLAISDLSNTRMKDALGTVGITEGVIRPVFFDEQNIVFVPKEKEFTSKVEGGYVKIPLPGLKHLMCINDFASLYPTLIRQFNIAAESYVGIYDARTNTAFYKGKITDLSKGKYIVTAFGAVFKHEESSTKKLFGNIYNNRKRYKNLMKDEISKKKKLETRLKELQESL
jgi:DNA polymerase elongation subunit (family B)